ncbi:FAD-dependent oxidoreductase [Helicobacter muridarum]|uniref:FAD-dependent oxidoreductase n=1 Tax=Helicobacter muridarum TaxID=216 RepID=A0A099TYQ3_9HELI|nr:FAD-dependent oxidoreductase [Helicobacter muridarum]TLE00353.1 FAD-dependent oxidoreductase [Helicobacter muridarum]STQ85858.1 putative amine oxidase [Helicobacter muridarum]
MKKVLIIGAGPAGLAAGRLLSENGYEVIIFEESTKVGGMSKSLNMFDQIVDIGPHRFFSKDNRLNDFWHEHTSGSFQKVSRLTRIFYNHKFFYYPLRGFDALFKLGILESFLCVLSYVRAKIKPFDGNSFESWVANAFGYRLYSIFFKSYTEKLWGISCKDLDSDFASQRIKGLNLYEAVKSAFFGGGGKKHKTLVDEFSYPNMGCGVVYDNMAREIVSKGGHIVLDAKVLGIRTRDKKAYSIITNNGEFRGDIIISSAPFDDMVCSLEELDSSIKHLASKLSFRNTILVYIEVNASNIFRDNWIYVHSKDVKTGRITNFANWTKDLQCGRSETILCLEYWANDDDELWNLNEDSIIEIAKNDLLDSKLVENRGQIARSRILKIHKSYPVYERGYKENLHKIYEALDGFANLYFIGRNGSFKYNNQDHSLLMGLMCADKILGKECDLWHINTDYDYQEGNKTELNN